MHISALAPPVNTFIYNRSIPRSIRSSSASVTSICIPCFLRLSTNKLSAKDGSEAFILFIHALTRHHLRNFGCQDSLDRRQELQRLCEIRDYKKHPKNAPP